MDLHAAADDGKERQLPPEIAFLRGLLPEAVLDDAARRAEMIGVTAEAVLLGDGSIASESYYRALAAALGLPFAERPIRPAASAATADMLEAGVVTLQGGPQGWRFLAAPRGTVLRRLLTLFEHRQAPRVSPMAITSPERLEAIIRHDRRKDIVAHAAHALPEWNVALSARAGVTPVQAVVLLAIAVAFCAGAWRVPQLCLAATTIVFAAAFLLAVGLRLLATIASPPPAHGRPPDRMCDADLPSYSVIVPLYKEARVVRRLTAALDRLDYPRAKLDIVLVVEESDVATLEAIESMKLPGRYRTIMAPCGDPRTKPRALNIALQFVRGRYVVIYDAEDEPDPDQLRAAARAFADDPAVDCLQARLAIDNFRDSWISALFALEYAALFHVINPGLAALRLPIALGGTSNHFRVEVLRRVNGWDAWNVTEDIDLGIRLARFGHRVGSLESTTYEEAPHKLPAWLKQRCRWMKGWMVTLGTHSRAPGRLLRDLGWVSTLAVVAMLFGTVLSALLGPFCIVILMARALTGNLFWVRTWFDICVHAGSATLFGLGLAGLVWPVLLGLQRRRHVELCRWLWLYPVYLALLSLASWQALLEVFGRPHSWAKTEHGRAKQRLSPNLPG